MDVTYERRDELHLGDIIFLANVRDNDEGEAALHLFCADGFNTFDLCTRMSESSRLDLEDCAFRFIEGGDQLHAEGDEPTVLISEDAYASPRSPRELGSPRPDDMCGSTGAWGPDDGTATVSQTKLSMLTFGQTVQLQHVKSGKFLAASSSRVADRDTECMAVFLADSNEQSQFELVSVLRIQGEGTPVRGTNSVRLRSLSLGGVASSLVDPAVDRLRARDTILTCMVLSIRGKGVLRPKDGS